MSRLSPPPLPPPIATQEHGGSGNFRLRTLQVMVTLLTLMATGWVCTLGAIPAIIGLTVCKHVLVAVLMMGLGVDASRTKD